MKKDTSIFDIFQDPLLTIVALILLGTIWIIIPREGGQANGALRGLAEQQKTVDDLKRTLDSLEQRVEELVNRIRQLTADLHAMSSKEQEARNKGTEASRTADDLLRRIAGLKSDIMAKHDELQSLDRRIREARQAVEKSAVVDELDRKIRRLKEEIALKEALLHELENQVGASEMEAQKQAADADEQNTAIDDLKGRLAHEKEELGKLQEEKDKLNNALKGMPGFGEYTAVGRKKAIYIDTIDNRISEISPQNYEYQVLSAMENGRKVQVIKVTKRVPGSGEDIAEIKDSNSSFERLLKEHNKEQHFLVFQLHRETFGLFYEARKMAWKQGFQVDWDPRDDGPLYGRTGASPGDRIVR